ncbi:universal stress protein [Thermicanus aegyptius]|uniref:universal stress protein n=1 Tax=Thermicanus aegyptius TaxID=94009 RepID=UPI000A01750D
MPCDRFYKAEGGVHHTGHPSITICEVAKEVQAKLIVVGSHGRGFVARALLGSVAHDLLHRSHIPLLIATARK